MLYLCTAIHYNIHCTGTAFQNSLKYWFYLSSLEYLGDQPGSLGVVDESNPQLVRGLHVLNRSSAEEDNVHIRYLS